MGKKLVTDDEIKEIHKRISKGESITKLSKEYGISRQAYHQRLKKLGITALPKKREDRIALIDIESLDNISDMYDLAALLGLTFDEVLTLADESKPMKTNEKRMSYLKNHSHIKFKEAIYMIILKHFKISPIELIEVLKQKED